MLVVLDLDRLGRLTSELIKLIDELAEKEIGFKAINSPMDTTTPAGRAFLQIQAAFAEMERNIIRQRVKERIAAARARGRKGGRPRIMTVLMSVCGILTIILAIASIWYFVKSLILLGRNNVLLGIAGLFFWPLTQIIFYLAERRRLSTEDKKVLIHSVWMWIAVGIFGTLTAIL